MRLTAEQVTVILDTVSALGGPTAKVSLYGSRLDDSRHGGDVDLLIESTSTIGLLTRARIKSMLEQKLNLPVDVLACSSAGAPSAFVAIAKAQSQALARSLSAGQ